MVCGLVASIGIMVVEMALFIVRAVQLESAYEGTPSDAKLAQAELNTGSLRTSRPGKAVRGLSNNNSTDNSSHLNMVCDPVTGVCSLPDNFFDTDVPEAKETK